MLTAEGDDLISAGDLPVMWHHEGLDSLPMEGIWNADHRSLPDLGVQVEHLFDVTWIDVEAARQDHFLLPVHAVEKAVIIHAGDIAGIDPPIPSPLAGIVRFAAVAV